MQQPRHKAVAPHLTKPCTQESPDFVQGLVALPELTVPTAPCRTKEAPLAD
jgi:hypothetical protein